LGHCDFLRKAFQVEIFWRHDAPKLANCQGKEVIETMSTEHFPIACSLTDSELQQRRTDVLRQAKSAMTAVTETENGFIYQFASASDRIAALANLITLEHQCCPFLTFKLTVEPGNQPVSLELSGPEGTKEFLIALFD
jgi:hypothetical protein